MSKPPISEPALPHLLFQSSHSISGRVYPSSPPPRARPLLEKRELGVCPPLGLKMLGKIPLGFCRWRTGGRSLWGLGLSSLMEGSGMESSCLDCAHWLEEYVASTECGGSVFPGLESDGREKNESRQALLGSRYRTLASWARASQGAACPSRPPAAPNANEDPKSIQNRSKGMKRSLGSASGISRSTWQRLNS